MARTRIWVDSLEAIVAGSGFQLPDSSRTASPAHDTQMEMTIVEPATIYDIVDRAIRRATPPEEDPALAE